jgi:hypothetical protein
MTPALDPRPKRIFISYCHGGADEFPADAVYSALNSTHRVYIDKRNLIGEDWGARIDAELRQADFVIAFLSEQSVRSEMVIGEIRKAHRLAKEHSGKPRILPIRVQYRDPFDYPLSAILDPRQWGFWESQGDTGGLLAQLRTAIEGGSFQAPESQRLETPSEPSRPLAAPHPIAQIEIPGGAMPSQSGLYIERQADRLALAEIENEGVTISIKGPRQQGKSSLLVRILAHAQRFRKRTVFLDFQLVDGATLRTADAFYRWFAVSISDELGVQDATSQWWKDGLTNLQRCTRYIGQHLLPVLETQHVVLAMDEVDRVFSAGFSSDFFGMLRSWHNSRARLPQWGRLDLVLVTSTEPYLFIDNTQSPFNVGQLLDLQGFTGPEVGELNGRHSHPLDGQGCQALLELLGGHPYLTRRAFYLLATKQLTLPELVSNAAAERGPFGDHLRYFTSRLTGRPDLIEGLREVLRTQICSDALVARRLESAGLISAHGKLLEARCRLYADYFGRLLNV